MTKKIRDRGSRNKNPKTNAMRILDQAGISYNATEYEYDESDLSGVHAAEVLGLPPEEIFKTLVARAQKKSSGGGAASSDPGIFVFVIPVAETLDLKKAAKVAGQKKIEMVHVREIEGLTGYIRGGCSPIGMKRQYRTFVDISAKDLDMIYVSAGRRGLQIRIGVEDLLRITSGETCDLTEDR